MTARHYTRAMHSEDSESSRRTGWAVLACFALLLALAALRPLAVPDEGRYGEIGRWMLQSGDWLTPRLNGIPFFHKPPYLYWLEASAMAVLGVHAWALRWVPALHALLMLVVMWQVARRWGGPALAHRAVWMLGSSLAFLMGGQYVNHDMLVASWMSVAIFCLGWSFEQGRERPHVGWALSGVLACALGVLSKGLIGLLLPGLVLVLWLTLTWQWRKVISFPWLRGIALFLAVALPWFVLAHQAHPDMLAYMFGKHQFGRYTATTFNNARPWWFYGLAVVVLIGPWILWVLHLAWRECRPNAALTALRADIAQRRLMLLCWVTTLAILGFFSIPNSKLLGYALPVLPALALLAAWGWQVGMAGKPYARGLFRGLVVLALGLAVGANEVASRYTLRHSSADIAQALACVKGPDDVVFLAGDYAYDLPFLPRFTAPMVVLQDWPQLRQSAGDNWRRELFECADFDAQTARSLQTPAALKEAANRPGQWLVMPRGGVTELPADQAGFVPVFSGQAWALFKSPASAETRPEQQRCLAQRLNAQ